MHWDARTAKEPNHDDDFVRNADHVGDDLHLPATGPFRAAHRRHCAGRECDLPRGVKLVSSSGWYHDEAIQAENARKN